MQNLRLRSRIVTDSWGKRPLGTDPRYASVHIYYTFDFQKLGRGRCYPVPGERREQGEGKHANCCGSGRGSGERVIIDGPCLSACTMVLGVIPRERICVTSRARLGFHAAWQPGDNGRPVTSRAATRLLMDIYPENVRSWITRRGGLSPKRMFLSGRELNAMYPTCN